MRKTFLFLLGFLILPVLVFAETYWGGELPDISNTQLKAEVSVTGDVYTYSYTIISGSSNTGQIWSFDVDIKQPEGGIELSGEGLVNGSGYRRHSAAQVLSEPTTPKMIPVGLWSPPNWNSGLSVTGNAGWGADDDQDMIMPGQTLLFLDEIQECPLALNSLKYFCEMAREYAICAAGSLLGVKLIHTKGLFFIKAPNLAAEIISMGLILN